MSTKPKPLEVYSGSFIDKLRECIEYYCKGKNYPKESDVVNYLMANVPLEAYCVEPHTNESLFVPKAEVILKNARMNRYQFDLEEENKYETRVFAAYYPFVTIEPIHQNYENFKFICKTHFAITFIAKKTDPETGYVLVLPVYKDVPFNHSTASVPMILCTKKAEYIRNYKKQINKHKHIFEYPIEHQPEGVNFSPFDENKNKLGLDILADAINAKHKAIDNNVSPKHKKSKITPKNEQLETPPPTPSVKHVKLETGEEEEETTLITSEEFHYRNSYITPQKHKKIRKPKGNQNVIVMRNEPEELVRNLLDPTTGHVNFEMAAKLLGKMLASISGTEKRPETLNPSIKLKFVSCKIEPYTETDEYKLYVLDGEDLTKNAEIGAPQRCIAYFMHQLPFNLTNKPIPSDFSNQHIVVRTHKTCKIGQISQIIILPVIHHTGRPIDMVTAPVIQIYCNANNVVAYHNLKKFDNFMSNVVVSERYKNTKPRGTPGPKPKKDNDVFDTRKIFHMPSVNLGSQENTYEQWKKERKLEQQHKPTPTICSPVHIIKEEPMYNPDLLSNAFTFPYPTDDEMQTDASAAAAASTITHLSEIINNQSFVPDYASSSSPTRQTQHYNESFLPFTSMHLKSATDIDTLMASTLDLNVPFNVETDSIYLLIERALYNIKQENNNELRQQVQVTMNLNFMLPRHFQNVDTRSLITLGVPLGVAIEMIQIVNTKL